MSSIYYKMMRSRFRSWHDKSIKYTNKNIDPIKHVIFPNTDMEEDKNSFRKVPQIKQIVNLVSIFGAGRQGYNNIVQI